MMKKCLLLLVVAVICVACGFAYRVPAVSKVLESEKERMQNGPRYSVAFTRGGNTEHADLLVSSFRRSNLFAEVDYVDNIASRDYFIINVVSDQKYQSPGWPCGENNIFGLLPITCPLTVETRFSVTKAGVIDNSIIVYNAESENAQGWITIFLLLSKNWRYPYPLEDHYMNAAYQVHYELRNYVK